MRLIKMNHLMESEFLVFSELIFRSGRPVERAVKRQK
jgi:hypothetical protein